MMRRFFLAGALLFAGVGCVSHATPPPADATHPSLAAPDGPDVSTEPLAFHFKEFPSGKDHALAADRGKVVLLDVWATWCEPCKEALPLYQNLQKEYGARGLQVYALNVDDDSTEVGPFLQATKVTLPVLLDPSAAIAEAQLHVQVMPTTFLLDRKGVIRHTHRGFSEEYFSQFEAEIEGLLREKK